MTLLAVDPGADAGWARYRDNGILEACGLNTHAMTQDITRCVIERPMIYPGGRQKARPNDIIKLAVRAGEWGGRVDAHVGIQSEYVEPHKWKGTIAKDACHARIWATLTPDERTIVDKASTGVAPSKRHNILDAVGIGLWSVGRYR
jgi:hypothetical protein